MKEQIYEPVREFERQTSYCPLYLAWQIVDEASNYFRTRIPEAYADRLAQRAEVAFAHDPSWAREAVRRTGRRNREFILQFMRHWLAGLLARENPIIFRRLPESYKRGHPLPERPLVMEPLIATFSLKRKERSIRPRFVHGCGLLDSWR
ncbi:MAG: hypothetical protein ACLQSR_02280 [Limisphaerales bacterium]